LRSPEPHRRRRNDPPAIGADFNDTPLRICEVDIDLSCMLYDSQVNLSLNAFEVGTRLKHIQG
jgi:hypothetical protein